MSHGKGDVGDHINSAMTEDCHTDIAQLLGVHSLLTDPTEMSWNEGFRDGYIEEDDSRAGKHCLNPGGKYRGK